MQKNDQTLTVRNKSLCSYATRRVAAAAAKAAAAAAAVSAAAAASCSAARTPSEAFCWSGGGMFSTSFSNQEISVCNVRKKLRYIGDKKNNYAMCDFPINNILFPHSNMDQQHRQQILSSLACSSIHWRNALKSIAANESPFPGQSSLKLGGR